MVNEADVANMGDSFVEAKEDSIALSGGKFNCCFMIISANVIAVTKISVVESACEIQSTYATINQKVDADVELGLISFPILLSNLLSLTDKNPNYSFHLQIVP